MAIISTFTIKPSSVASGSQVKIEVTCTLTSSGTVSVSLPLGTSCRFIENGNETTTLTAVFNGPFDATVTFEPRVKGKCTGMNVAAVATDDTVDDDFHQLTVH